MELTYDRESRTDKKHLHALLEDFILSHNGLTLNGMSAASAFNSRYGLNVNWHEFSEVLDIMSRKGLTKFFSHNGGYVEYTVIG
jgi:hypothetical protein